VAGEIVSAWLLTIPACFVLGWVIMMVVRLVGALVGVL
jgi:phosphate/sulfate permease